MLKIRTRLAPSAIHGIGLFADEPIAAGTVVWEYDPHFDVAFSEAHLGSLSAAARQQVERYSYFEEALACHVLCGDDARFMNHSPTPNTEELEMCTVAARDIAVGEEITADYRTFDVATTA